MGSSRLLVVYGSMTGNTEKQIKKMAKHWKKEGVISSYDLFDGNTLAHETEDLATLVSSYDALVVGTSSFGEGDPPDNYNNFLLSLMTAAADKSLPLKGMQHAVLGEGSSVYADTFQNCPRLTDRYLEECGSRRFVARHEIDVGGEDNEDVGRGLFRDAVAARLGEGLGPADAAPAAAWSTPCKTHKEPVEQITIKTASELGGGVSSQTMGQILVPLTAVTLAVLAFLYSQFMM